MNLNQTNVSNELATAPVGKLLFKLAVPTVIAQFVNLLYNIVDRIYIGHMPGTGSAALTGIGLCFPIIYLISAFSALIGQGGAPRAAIYMGQNKHTEANRIMNNCFVVLILEAVVLTVFFWFFGEQLLWLFGCSCHHYRQTAFCLPWTSHRIILFNIGCKFCRMAGKASGRTAFSS